MGVHALLALGLSHISHGQPVQLFSPAASTPAATVSAAAPPDRVVPAPPASAAKPAPVENVAARVDKAAPLRSRHLAQRPRRPAPAAPAPTAAASPPAAAPMPVFDLEGAASNAGAAVDAR